MNDTKNIMIVGVGGQGSLLASRVIGNLLVSQGYDVKVSEVHGMAQRGGSVVTHVRYGSDVHAPIVDVGEADIVIAFEELEGARTAPWLKKGGHLIVNRQRIDPMPVITGAAEYPSDIEEKMKAQPFESTFVDALTPAMQAGSAKAVNIVLLGVASRFMSFPEEAWLSALETSVPGKFLEMNKTAFSLGRNASI